MLNVFRLWIKRTFHLDARNSMNAIIYSKTTHSMLRKIQTWVRKQWKKKALPRCLVKGNLSGKTLTHNLIRLVPTKKKKVLKP